MGDRCNIVMEIGGTITSPKVAIRVAKAVFEFRSDDADDFWDVLNNMAEAWAAGIPWHVEFDEVNYADTGEVDTVLDEAHLTWTKYNGAGGGYTAATAWHNFGLLENEWVMGQEDVWSTSENEEGAVLSYGAIAAYLKDPESVASELQTWMDMVDRPAPPINLDHRIAHKWLGLRVLTGKEEAA